ncbi:MAG: YciI family protein [Pseudomonadota bacterium]
MERVIAYSVLCKDKPGDEAAKIRDQLMPNHLAHIEKTVDSLWLAGPLFDADKVVGSLLIFKADSAEQALEMAKQDPYYEAGIWASMEARRFVGAAGDWVGGKTW